MYKTFLMCKSERHCPLYQSLFPQAPFLSFFLSFFVWPLLSTHCRCTWSHSNTRHSVGLLWTGDQPVAETSTWQHTSLTRDRYSCPPPVGFEPTIPARERRQTHALDRAGKGIAPTTPSPSSIMCKHCVSSLPSSSCPIQCARTIQGGARVNWHSLFNHRNAVHTIPSYLWDSTYKCVGKT